MARALITIAYIIFFFSGAILLVRAIGASGESYFNTPNPAAFYASAMAGCFFTAVLLLGLDRLIASSDRMNVYLKILAETLAEERLAKAFLGGEIPVSQTEIVWAKAIVPDEERGAEYIAQV